MDSKKISVALLDDHISVRQGIKDVLIAQGNINVSMDCDNGSVFLKKMNQLVAPGDFPDLVLLDISMPEMNGFDTLRQIRITYPSLKVLVFSAFVQESYIINMIKLGANGYLDKSCTLEELFLAIKIIVERGFYHTDLISDVLVKQFQTGIVGNNEEETFKLTKKEIEFIELCCSEISYSDIAKAMKVSTRTIDGYRESVFKKVKVTTRVGLVLFAVRNKIIENNSTF